MCRSSSFLFGDRLTYADLALLHVLRATESQFPQEWARAKAGEFAALDSFKGRMEQR